MIFADWNDWIETSLKVLGGVVATLGGVVAYWRFVVERVHEQAADIAVSVREPTLDAPTFVFVEVCLTNKGKVKVHAKTERKDGYVFNDGVEMFRHSFTLQVKRVDTANLVGPAHLHWFDSPALKSVEGLDEFNVLYEYEMPDRNGQAALIDFWMEPGEGYHFGIPLTMNPGFYLGKITFVAAGGDTNFWSRIFLIRVPDPKLPTRNERE
ncbi:unnamed protein product [Gemmata massiliana]|uniref:Uncharacterized protein n=1 Tax=Gemmata massiliana TaxID=1210884 RepID=A0A6P2D8H2_9BACT|nr:hypothetical protein [Gemmata massiliana]VTR97243.1 unnamed protein product [Gemmata massiliana]